MPLEKLAKIKASSADSIEEGLRNDLRDQFLSVDPIWRQALEARDRAKSQAESYRNSAKASKVMVLEERAEPRESHILERGVWDAKGKVVTPGILSSIYSTLNSEP